MVNLQFWTWSDIVENVVLTFAVMAVRSEKKTVTNIKIELTIPKIFRHIKIPHSYEGGGLVVGEPGVVNISAQCLR